ncbi:MAG: 23S rRNA (adenine(2503)-C(2))-methyltransferase RlmN [Paludibacteraceae bacterium]|nr:23S rRNA (adenine(2503)-C(2))-methyltransferase RlmN [Paludibacteraceae bacterium]
MDILLGKTLTELQAIAEQCGLPKYTGKQLANWLYVRRVSSIDEMTDISLKGREALKAHYQTGRHSPEKEAVSKDGTKKYLFQVAANYIESVFIPEEDRATLCVSTQAGCKMKCKFCMTGTLGFQGQLSAADILNQVFSIPESAQLTNIVLMGEGEPMDNLDNVLRFLDIMTADYGPAWSPKRITVSSVGLLPGLKRYLDESDCHLAISLHNPFHVEREQIMPAERAYAINKVIELLKKYDFSHQRRVSFEYICWGGINDTPKHANELIRLLKGLECRINLIRYHDGGQADFPASDEQQMQWLATYLTEKGVTTTIRKSRGEDILAACGMLVNSLTAAKEPINRL